MTDKMKRNYLNPKGITLIALVVTIVVLLILAGVSISVLFGNDGIIAKVRDAKKVTNLSSLKEEIGIVIQARNVNKMSGLPLESLKESLENGISGDRTVETIGSIEDTCYVTREEATVTVYDNGDIIDGKADIWDGTSKSKPTADESKNWHIYTPEEMKYFEEFVNGKLTDEEKEGLEITDSTIVYLENNIDMGARQKDGVLTAGTAWDPIGIDNAGKFTGTFEGNNHTVRGIYVKKDGKFAGIFGNSDTIQNLTIVDSYIEASGECVGGIVAALREGSIINCDNIGTNVVSTGEGTNGRTVGGIVGQFTGTQIENCKNIGNVKSKGTRLGGIVGIFVGEKIKDCTNFGDVYGEEQSVGGIAGRFTGKKIEDCVNDGKITGGIEKGNGFVGGIAGWVDAGDVINCTNKSIITGRGIDTGGIIGGSEGEKIQNCINLGTIYGGIYDGNTLSNCGGIVGGFLGKIVENSINKGIINAKRSRAGGIAGEVLQNSIIIKCINVGGINGLAQIGGIVGGLNGIIEQCYNSGEVKGVEQLGGICGSVLNKYESTIKNCYNIGSIIPEKSSEYSEWEIQYLGGIIGWMSSNQTSGTISNNYNIGKIETEGKNATYVGGVIGLLSKTFTIKNNYYIAGIPTTSEELAVAGERKSETEMKKEEFLALLNADQETPVWELNPSKNNGYPSLIGVDM